MKTNVDKPLHELEGFLELGMARESLALARKLLDSTPIDAARFFVCVDVLLIQGSQLPKWRSRVNAAHERLTAADQRAVREKLFHFYVTLEDWASPHAFLPPRPTSTATLLFSMWTLLELRKTDAAKKLHRRCERWWVAMEEEFDKSCCLEAIAMYCAQTGQWAQAERVWSAGEQLMPFAPNATEGIIKIHALMAQQKAEAAVARLKSGLLTNGDCGLMLPSGRGSSKHAEAELRRCARHLAKVVPNKERWRFGLDG